MIDLDTIHVVGEETEEQFKQLAVFLMQKEMSIYTAKTILNSDRFVDYLLNCVDTYDNG